MLSIELRSGRLLPAVLIALLLIPIPRPGLSQPAAAAWRYSVMNPTGYPPPIERKAMAPRPDSLEGRTIYLVDITFNNGDVLLARMQDWLTENMPDVNIEYRIKQGLYASDDPELWQEIQANNGLMIIAIGH